jgi:hypothetical protein
VLILPAPRRSVCSSLSMQFPILDIQALQGNGSYRWQDQFKQGNQRDFQIQLLISFVFGTSAFLAFCV